VPGDDRVQTPADARAQLRREREAKTDAVIELPFNERVEVDCPVCGASKAVAIYVPTAKSPEFGSCWNWDCDAFLKFQTDGTEATTEPQEVQTGLDRFATAGGGPSE